MVRPIGLADQMARDDRKIQPLSVPFGLLLSLPNVSKRHEDVFTPIWKRTKYNTTGKSRHLIHTEMVESSIAAQQPPKSVDRYMNHSSAAHAIFAIRLTALTLATTRTTRKVETRLSAFVTTTN